MFVANRSRICDRNVGLCDFCNLLGLAEFPAYRRFLLHLATIQSNSLSIPLSITCAEENQTIETLGLIDSGAGGKFIDQNFARQHKFKIQPLDKPIVVQNVDGTENKQGKITHFINLKLNVYQKTMRIQLMVTGLGKQKIILGFQIGRASCRERV